MIGNKIIEIHLRRNPDFATHDSPYIIPVWKGQKKIRKNHMFIEAKDGDRLGYFVPGPYELSVS